ncbi:putative claudin-24 [Panthera tigris]|uniref:putative claudin-24 n=1 Tax=Panthera tigris TaxID=9694 RepID=UPI00042C283C|nr:putative claudin-24 [Panthera tigris]
MTSGVLCLVKNAGLLGSLAGQVCSLVTLCIPQWLTLSSGLLESEKYTLGLWETCVTQDTGGRVCQASASLRDLATEMLVARILMCGACVAGSLGLVAVLLGLTCVRYGGHQGSSLERSTNVAGGALFFLAGLATLVPVSYIARVTVQRFWGPEFPTDVPRWDYGNAMFSGWIGGFFLLTGGLLLIASQLCANRLAEKPTSFPSKLDFSRKVPFAKVDFV